MRSKMLFLLAFTIMQSAFVMKANPYKLTITGGMDDPVLKNRIETSVSSLLSEFKDAVEGDYFPGCSKNYVTKDGRNMITSMWKTSGMVCQEYELDRNCITDPKGGYEIRDIPVTMVEAQEDTKYKHIVVKLTNEGMVDDIYIALEKTDYATILDQNESVTDFRRRQIVIDFVENYRTAYNRKDLPYIKSVFSDNALIITGKVVKEAKKTDRIMNALGDEKIQYVKQNKEEYVRGLSNVFKRNSYINVLFDDIEVLTHPKYPNFYGVTLLQHWNTTNYSDVGYLFLMIEFKDNDVKNGDNILIHVRTWQPEKFQGRQLTKNEILGWDDFSSAFSDIIY